MYMKKSGEKDKESRVTREWNWEWEPIKSECGQRQQPRGTNRLQSPTPSFSLTHPSIHPYIPSPFLPQASRPACLPFLPFFLPYWPVLFLLLLPLLLLFLVLLLVVVVVLWWCVVLFLSVYVSRVILLVHLSARLSVFSARVTVRISVSPFFLPS